MQIDWITVVAQVVNFLVLVWLLRRFLFGPVVRAMERREQSIANRLSGAEKSKEAAEAQGRAYRDQQAGLERQKQAILSEAREAAQETKRELLRAARADADARRREWLGQVEAQHQEFLEDLRRRAGEQFFVLARQMLRDMADTDLEAHMVSVFLRHLTEIGPDIRKNLAAAAREAGRVTVESCFKPAQGKRADLTRGIRDALAVDAGVEYRCDPARPFGIELRAGSQIVLWTFDDYLNQMERNVDQLLARRPPRPTAARQEEAEAS